MNSLTGGERPTTLSSEGIFMRALCGAIITAGAMMGDLLTAVLWRDAAIKVYEVLAGEKESFFDVFGRCLLQAGVPVD